MKWGKPKREKFSEAYTISARKNGYKAYVCFNPPNALCISDFFYFMCEKGNEAYNSLWDKKAYKTEEAAKVACEKWIDEQVGGTE